MTVKLAVASRNPVKINAAFRGFEIVFPEKDFHAEGFSIESGVSDQPMTDEETLRGARQRVEGVMKACEADFAIGIEGGIDVIDNQMQAFAWIVITDGNKSSQARSGSFALPPRVQELVRSGEELGVANDIVFGEQNSKQQGGAIGSLTGGVISRQRLYEHAMALALVPWIKPELF
ncbi:MAG: inosine/xanthosine triphosphatase [Planctomycetota bacterium]